MGLEIGRPQPLQVKAVGDDWEVSGYLSTYSNVDGGGDVVLPGAFDASIASGRKAKFLFAHDDTKILGPPLQLRSDDRGLFATGKISKTALGSEVHTLLVDGALDSWSIGYLPTEFSFEDRDGAMVRLLKAVDLFEGSLVAVPLNEQAVVTGVKSALAALETKGPRPVHHTDTSAGTWDGPANEARLQNDDDRAWYDASAWFDANAPDPNGDGKPDRKGDYRFWHHEVSGEGAVGAANVKACQTGIGVLNGGRGGTTIPDSDRAGVYRHLAAHLRDAGLEPPELKGLAPDSEQVPASSELKEDYIFASAAESARSWDAHAQDVIGAAVKTAADIVGFSTRARVRVDLRAKEGRRVSADTRQLIEQVLGAEDGLKAAFGVLRQLLEDTAPPPKGYRPRADILARRLRLAGVLTDETERSA